MARVLLGQELGAGASYANGLATLARQLQAAGHDVSVALQRPELWPPVTGVPVFQAPIWPALLRAVPLTDVPIGGMADILGRLGLGRPGTFAAMLRAWDATTEARRPDLVIANFAPALLTAAQGRLRAVSIGTGFSQPPPGLPTFPAFATGSVDEGALLTTVEDELRATGRRPVATLPALFAADAQLVQGFAELDPYRDHRAAPHLAAPIDPAAIADGSGSEIFVYGHIPTLAAGPLWDALRDARLPVRVVAAEALPGDRAALRSRGLIVEPRPLPWARIAARSRLVISHGGHGTACAALAAGLPHRTIAVDLEKSLTAAALLALDAGGPIAPTAQTIRAAYDEARPLADTETFRNRGGETLDEAVLRLLS